MGDETAGSDPQEQHVTLHDCVSGSCEVSPEVPRREADDVYDGLRRHLLCRQQQGRFHAKLRPVHSTHRSSPVQILHLGLPCHAYTGAPSRPWQRPNGPTCAAASSAAAAARAASASTAWHCVCAWWGDVWKGGWLWGKRVEVESFAANEVLDDDDAFEQGLYIRYELVGGWVQLMWLDVVGARGGRLMLLLPRTAFSSSRHARMMHGQRCTISVKRFAMNDVFMQS